MYAKTSNDSPQNPSKQGNSEKSLRMWQPQKRGEKAHSAAERGEEERPNRGNVLFLWGERNYKSLHLQTFFGNWEKKGGGGGGGPESVTRVLKEGKKREEPEGTFFGFPEKHRRGRENDFKRRPSLRAKKENPFYHLKQRGGRGGEKKEYTGGGGRD